MERPFPIKVMTLFIPLRVSGLIFLLFPLFELMANSRLVLPTKVCLEQSAKSVQSEAFLPLTQVQDRVRATQFLYGEPRIKYLLNKLRNMSLDEIKDYIGDRSIPFVRRGHELYIVDAHHFTRAILLYKNEMVKRGMDLGKLELRFSQIADFTDYSETEFWKKMLAGKLTFPYVNGRFVDPIKMPPSPLDLQVDFYRGLAWVIRELKGFEKTTVPFSEFYWGEYFRRRMQLEPNEYKLSRQTIEAALKLAREDNQTTRFLPGFIEPHKHYPLRRHLFNLETKLRPLGIDSGATGDVVRGSNIVQRLTFLSVHRQKKKIKKLIRKLKKMKPGKIRKWIKRKIVMAVRGPDNLIVPIRDHHMPQALAQLKNDPQYAPLLEDIEVNVKVVDDYSHAKNIKELEKLLSNHDYLE